jgi:chorismate mutase
LPGANTVAIRGATTVERDDPELIQSATRELLREIVTANGVATEDIISVIFTVTADLKSEFPARAARELGWTDVPLLCASEIDVPGSLRCCVRILMHTMSSLSRAEVKHIYLRNAVGLRGGGATPPGAPG